MTSDLNEHESAAAEARERGMAFIVDGKHVNADRIFILSLPDTTGPISDMRRAKADAERTMRELEAFKIGRAEATPNVRNEMTGQYLRSLMNAAGMPTPPEHHDDEYLGTHSYITMCDIEAAVGKLVAELAAARAETERLDWFDKQRQAVPMGYSWSITVDSGITNVRLAMDSKGALRPIVGKHQCTSPKGGFACKGCTCGAPVIPTVISSQGCGICGVAFTGQGWVCLSCAGAKS